MKKLILKWALKNAVDHDGKAVAGAIISKAISEDKKLKDDMKKLGKEVAKIVKEVNSMDFGEQIAKLQSMAPELLEKKEEKRGIPELPNAKKGKVVMMFPPEPSKLLTIGHAKAALLNYLSCKENDGKFIVRFEDTNYSKIKSEYYDAMLEDLKWIGIKWDAIDYESDHVEKFYEYAEKLIKKKKAYMCNCPSEKVRELRGKGEECLCRSNTVKENINYWKKMLKKEFKEGDFSLRVKIDMGHQNTTMRDPTILRMLVGNHPRVGDKYFIWPTYDFATAVMDDIEGVTHRYRSKEFEMRAELQQWIQKQLGIKSPVVIEFARFNLEGVPSSGRIMREMISKGKLTGWDDPRLPTLIALRKRGFQPAAIKNFVINTGLSKSNSLISWSVIEAENRKIVEPIAKRYFMVRDAVKMIIKKAPENFKTKIRLHPDDQKAGFKEYEFPGKELHVFVDKKDMLNKKQDDKIRLMELCNVKLEVFGKNEIIAHFESKEMQPGMKIIQWVPTTETKDIEILMADAETFYGLAEGAVDNIKKGEIIQFIRFGFCRLNEKGKTLKFRFTHT